MSFEVVYHTTADWIEVTQFDFVYEIQYAWINFEVSLAYPVKSTIHKLPAGTKVWRWESSVLRECYKRNKPKDYEYMGI